MQVGGRLINYLATEECELRRFWLKLHLRLYEGLVLSTLPP